MDYSELPQFEKYHLQGGWLIDIREGDSYEFTVEAELTYAHPLLRRTLWEKIRDLVVRDLPPPGVPDWATIVIVFPRVRSARWIRRIMKLNVDPDGRIDLGDIYSFTVEGDKSHLSGAFGEIEIVSDPVQVREIGQP